MMETSEGMFHAFFYTYKGEEGARQPTALPFSTAANTTAAWLIDNAGLDDVEPETYWKCLYQLVLTAAPQGYFAWQDKSYWFVYLLAVDDDGAFLDDDQYGIHLVEFTNGSIRYAWVADSLIEQELDEAAVTDFVHECIDWERDDAGAVRQVPLTEAQLEKLGDNIDWTDELHNRLGQEFGMPGGEPILRQTESSGSKDPSEMTPQELVNSVVDALRDDKHVYFFPPAKLVHLALSNDDSQLLMFCALVQMAQRRILKESPPDQVFDFFGKTLELPEPVVQDILRTSIEVGEIAADVVLGRLTREQAEAQMLTHPNATSADVNALLTATLDVMRDWPEGERAAAESLQREEEGLSPEDLDAMSPDELQERVAQVPMEQQIAHFLELIEHPDPDAALPVDKVVGAALAVEATRVPAFCALLQIFLKMALDETPPDQMQHRLVDELGVPREIMGMVFATGIDFAEVAAEVIIGTMTREQAEAELLKNPKASPEYVKPLFDATLAVMNAHPEGKITAAAKLRDSRRAKAAGKKGCLGLLLAAGALSLLLPTLAWTLLT